MWWSTCISHLLLVLTTLQHIHSLPFLGDLLSGVEVSVKSTSSWDRRSDEIRVEDHLRRTLQRMADDPVAKAVGGAMQEPLPLLATLEQTAAGATFRLSNMAVTGLRAYSVEAVDADLATHEFSYSLLFPRVTTRGQYELEYYWTATEGDFHITMHQLTVKGRGLLDVHGNGTVTAASGHTHQQLSYDYASCDLGSPGLVNTIAQTAIGALGPYLLEVVEPASLRRVALHLTKNSAVYVRQLDEARQSSNEGSFGGSFSALDSAVLELRRRVRSAGMDPLPLPAASHQLHDALQLELSDGALTGLSALSRSGELAVAPGVGAAKATLALGTGRVTGRYRWTIRGFEVLEKSGLVRFSVDGIKLRARLAASVAAAGGEGRRPRIEDIDIDVGEISLRCEGAGRFDYLLNVGAQGLPVVLKSVLVKAVEAPLVWIIENQAQYLGLV